MATNFLPTNPNKNNGTSYNAPLSTYYIPDYGPTQEQLTGGGSGNTPTNPLQSVMSFLGTPGGAAVTNLVGGGLSAYGNYQQNQQNLKQNALQFAATSAQNQYNTDRQLATQRAAGVLTADPLGADQNFAAKQALKAAILKSGPARSGDAAIPQSNGGVEGAWKNFDPSMAEALFGSATTAQSIAQRHNELSNLDPNAPTGAGTLGALYGPNSAAGAPAISQVQNWATKVQQMDASQRQQFDAQMKSYIDQMVQQEQDSGGFWHKFAQIAGVVGAAAATLMTAGGASPLLAGAIGAASGAAGSWGSGGNPLMGAITGGATSYAGAKLKGNS